MSVPTNSGSTSARWLAVATALAVLVVVAVVVAFSWSSLQGAPQAPMTSSSQPQSTPTMTPPVDEEPQPAATPDGISVVVTYAELSDDGSRVQVAGYVEGIVETNGTCTLRAERGGESSEISSPSMPDASTTQCGSLAISTELLGSGEWTVTLSYESAAVATVSSPSVMVMVS